MPLLPEPPPPVDAAVLARCIVRCAASERVCNTQSLTLLLQDA
jgi:hypothetical protein